MIERELDDLEIYETFPPVRQDPTFKKSKGTDRETLDFLPSRHPVSGVMTHHIIPHFHSDA